MQSPVTSELAQHDGAAMRTRPSSWPGVYLTATLAVVAFALIRMGAALPADAFYSGDCGVKVIAAQNAAKHPASPLTVDPPRTRADGPPAYLESFFVAHDNHAHAVQAPLFPLLAAPLIARFGLRGAYAIPAAALLVFIALLCVAARAMGATGIHLAAVLTIAVLANPLLFYSLEIWEHLPAATLLAASTVLVFAERPRHAMLLGAGLAGGVAALIRPEAAWYVAALAVVIAIERREWPSVMYLILGCAIAIAPFALYNQVHFGTPEGLHLQANFSHPPHGWLAERLRLVGLWLVPNVTASEAGPTMPVGGSLAAWLALTGIGASWLWGTRSRHYDRPQVLAMSCAVVLAVFSAAGWLNRENLWQACPIAGLAALPIAPSQRTRFWKALVVLVVIASAGVILSAPNDGGAQWGPRYLLIASPAILLLAALNVAMLLRSRRVLAIACVALVFLASAYVSRRAYADLRGAKRYYARIVGETEKRLPRGGYLLTDLWWFDQVTAALHDRGTMLFAGDEATANQALRELDGAGVRSVLAVRSRSESRAGTLQQWVAGTNYSIGDSYSQQERELTYVALKRR